MTLLLLWTLAGPGALVAQDAPEQVGTIGGLNCDRRGDAVLVSFRVLGAFGPELRSSLDGGRMVIFTHELSIARHRTLWFSKQVAAMRIEATATFDGLTQRYMLTRRVDDAAPESSSTDRAAEAERWLSEVSRARIPLRDPDGGGSLDVKVKTIYGHDFLLFLLPWPLNAKDHAECR